MAPKALITGISGQDGFYLSELLLGKGYEVHGLVRHAPSDGDPRLLLHVGDMTDAAGLRSLVEAVRPDEVYNLAAQNPQASFEDPLYTGETDGLGATRLLEAIRAGGLGSRFFQASSSEMFGRARPPQDETTPFKPTSPYGVAKLYAHWMTAGYRDAHGLYACSGILFNHESPRRRPSFVTRRITRGVAMIVAGRQDRLTVGNLSTRRDWGHARDYVEAMWLMLQQPAPEDFVIATGRSQSIEELLQTAFGLVGLDWRRYVDVDPAYVRPGSAVELRGDPARAAQRLGWQPRTSFEDLVQEMVEEDLVRAGADRSMLVKPPRTG